MPSVISRLTGAIRRAWTRWTGLGRSSATTTAAITPPSTAVTAPAAGPSHPSPLYAAAVATAPPRRAAGPGLHDIRDVHIPGVPGALPGAANAARTRAAIQAAHDAFAGRVSLAGGLPWGQVFIPADPLGYWIDRWIWGDLPRIEFVGEGPGSILATVSSYGGPALLHGLCRAPGGIGLTTDHLFDLFGLLDTSAASAPGQRWGFRIKDAGVSGSRQGDSVLSVGPSVFALGPAPAQVTPTFWRAVPTFTIDWAVDWTATVTHSGPYWGMNRPASGAGMPFYTYQNLDTTAGTASVDFYFRTLNGTFDEGPNGGDTWRARLTIPPTLGLRRLTLAVDLPNKLILGYADGFQVAVAVTPAFGNPQPSFSGAGTLQLVAATGYPFQFGPVTGLVSNVLSSFQTWTGTMDRRFCGFRIATGLLYKNQGVGQAQQRTDNGTVNDSYRYFSAPTGTLGYFPMQDSPASVAASCQVKIKSGDAGSQGDTYAAFLTSGNQPNSAAVDALNLADLTISANPNSPYSEGLVLNDSLSVSGSRLTILAGANAVSSWHYGANYFDRFTDCDFAGRNATIDNYNGVHVYTNCKVSQMGRSGVWNNGGAMVLDGLILPDGIPGVTEYVLRSVQGGSLEVNGVRSDTEGYPPSGGHVYAETGGADVRPKIRIIDSQFAVSANDTPVVTLHDATGMRGDFLWDGNDVSGSGNSALVQVDSPHWIGEVRHPVAPDCPAIRSISLDGKSGIRATHTAHLGPPRSGASLRGAHRLLTPAVADGQYLEWLCTASGEYGTLIPPGWLGRTPADEGLNGLAVYLVGHSCWGWSGGTTLRGFWTDYAAAATLNLLFRGAVTPTAPATVYAGLGTSRARRDGVVGELTAGSAPGYARQATTWAASAGGVAANGGAFTFTSTSGAWSGIRCLPLFDAPTGGHVLAVLEIAGPSAPLGVASGGTLTFGTGTVSVRRTAHVTLAGGAARFSAFSPYLADQVHNFWLRAAALPAPTNLTIALSTSPADPTGTPTEPSGGGYARLSFARATGFPVAAVATSNAGAGRVGMLLNGPALAFATPSGTWVGGPSLSAYLMDGSNIWAAGDLTIARSIGAGSAAPTFAAGALFVGCG